METEINAHVAFWVVSVFMWIMFVWSKFSDPGYIKTNREAYEEALKLVYIDNGHIEDEHFVHCSEVVPSAGRKSIGMGRLQQYEQPHLQLVSHV